MAKSRKDRDAETQAVDTPTEMEAGMSNGTSLEPYGSKKEAVRKIIEEEGNMPPGDLQKRLLDRFGIVMSYMAVASTKSGLGYGQGSRKKKSGTRKTTEKKAAGSSAAESPKTVSGEKVSVDDIRQLKAMVKRMGPARIRELLELFV